MNRFKRLNISRKIINRIFNETKTDNVYKKIAKAGDELKRSVRVIFDITSQNQGGFFIKSRFFLAFCLHYIGKKLNLYINTFPRMNLRLEDCLFTTREKTVDFWVFWKNYELDVKKEIDKIKGKGTFIDVGAHIGLYSVLMAKKGFKVYAFEPIKSNYVMLKTHTLMNDTKNQIKLYNLALGNKKQYKNICFESHKYGEASFLSNIKKLQLKKPTYEKVLIEKMDNLILNEKLKKPVILKIDVEGFEHEILLGAKKFIKKHKPIIIIEIWNKKTIDFLNKMNYKQQKGGTNGIFLPINIKWFS